MAIIKLNANGFNIVTSRRDSDVNPFLDRIATERLMSSGSNALGNSDVGYLPRKVEEAIRIISPFVQYSKLTSQQNEMFTSARDAIAEAAQKASSQLNMNALSNGSVSNAPAPPSAPLNTSQAVVQQIRAATGSSFTGFYADIRNGELALGADSPLDVTNVDFNDANSVSDYFNDIQKYANQINIRDHVGYNTAELFTGEQELMILLHTENQEFYGAYIEKFEKQISDNFQRELASLQQNARSLGFTGNVKNVTELESFKNTLSGASKYQVQKLIDATTGKANQVDQYILGRIHNGDIDIQKIVATGQFNGVDLDIESQAAFRALAVYANTDAIATGYHNDILADIGFQSNTSNIDLNNITQVKGRVKEFETALSQAGFGAIGTKVLKEVPLKQLRTLDMSQYPEKVQKVLSQYTALREHADTLQKISNAKRGMARSAIAVTRKALGDSDISNGIGQIYSTYKNAEFAMKTAARSVNAIQKFDKFLQNHLQNHPKLMQAYQKMRQPIADAYNSTKNFIQNIKNRLPNSSGTNASSTTSTSVTTQAQNSAQRQATRSAKQTTRNAKSAQNKLIKQAGKRPNPNAQNIAKTSQNNITSNANPRLSNAQNASKTARTGGVNNSGVQSLANTSKATNVANASQGANMANVAQSANVSANAATTASTSASAAGTAGGLSAGTIALIVIVVLLVFGAISIYIGMLADMVGQTVASLDDSLLSINWPWAATEDQIQNTFMSTIDSLKEEEAKSKDITSQVEKLGTFHSGLTPSSSTESSGVTWGREPFIYNSEESTADNTHYIFLDGDKEPINEYTTIKWVISMAHAFTYHIDYKEQLKDFAIYSVGLYNYLNTSTVEAKISFCEGEGTYTYYCNTPETNSPLYKNIVNTHKYHYVTSDEKINGRTLAVDEDELLYIVNGTIVPHTNYGCVRYVYDAQHKTATKYVNGSSPSTWNISVVSLFNNSDSWKNWWNQEHDKSVPNKAVRSTGKYDENGKLVYYDLAPNIAPECLSDYTASEFVNHVTYCSATDIESGKCNNSLHKLYKTVSTPITEMKYDTDDTKILRTNNGSSTYYHWTTSTPAASHSYQTVVYYSCKGHDDTTYCTDGYVILSASYTWNEAMGEYTVGYPHLYNNVIGTTPGDCDNYDSVMGYDAEEWLNDKTAAIPKRTYYYCKGHEDYTHADHTADYTACDNRSNVKTGYYNCQHEEITGYDVEKFYVDVCKGHILCSGMHYECPGHKFTYCSSHIAYTLTRETLSSEESMYSDDWEYTVSSNFLWVDTSKTYSPAKEPRDGVQSLARKDWAKWGKWEKEAAMLIFSSDWYLNYGLGLADFVGAQASQHEILCIKEQYNIVDAEMSDILRAYLDTAFYSIGRIGYFPGDMAVCGGYDGNNFNTTVPEDERQFDNHGVLVGVHGLDSIYYADWVYRTTRNDATTALLTNPAEQVSRVTELVTSSTPAGAPIVCKDASGINRTGILVGVKNGQITYIGMGMGNWVTLVTEPIGNWYTAQTLWQD